MHSYGSKEYLIGEVQQSGGAIRMFDCPRCKAKKGYHCRRSGGYGEVRTHKEREDLWRQYAHEAPDRLAWLERMVLPIVEYVADEVLEERKGTHSDRNKAIAMFQKRVREERVVLGRIQE